MKTYIKIKKSIITDRIEELEKNKNSLSLLSQYNTQIIEELQSILKQSEEIK